ncbi:DUF2797 domain-containing protein [Tepidibacillus infernus]|uniref:DUF2797 domain-containing protein n=1 Tax=Tepidibacillus TaxID=1494427 RepID=UPI0008534D4D|nr:DUF2797 domain-containing protein [Tepidibacillus sp. HK-1]GBF10177.1 hypothetical protein HK1_00189 [Tepidibacillus sp. HK-1]
MKVSGELRELVHKVEEPVQYFLQINEENIHLNPYIGKQMKLSYQNEIHCIHCGRKIKKSYNNGSCYPCFVKLPQNDLCIVKPHECHFDQGTCRDESFAEDHCMVPHYVYLALSSDVKVGLTRKTNAFKRWVDQGAVQSIPIAELPTRKMAGELEFYLSQFMPDKTNWRKMLKGEIAEKDLFKIREEIREKIPEEFHPYLLEVEQIHAFIYPILETLDHISSLTLDKQSKIEGRLLGIKGQYLLLDSGVINIKKHAGYLVQIELIDESI